MSVEIPDDATDDEAAAIIAAVRTHTAAMQAAATTEDDDNRSNARWRLSARIEALQNRRVRTPKTAPRDEWTTAGRTDRF